jgi:hypothetical protein
MMLARTHSWLTTTTILVALSAAVVSCREPFIKDQIAALGDEAPGFEPNEIHRPGSPCVLCHSKRGGKGPEFSLGGTLFFRPPNSEPLPAENYVVRVLDSEGELFDLVSNRCGNFYLPKETFEPAFPLNVSIFSRDPTDPQKLIANEPMVSRIGRDGSCAACHKHPESSFSPGVSFVTPPDGVYPDSIPGCPPNNFAPQLEVAVQGQQ